MNNSLVPGNPSLTPCTTPTQLAVAEGSHQLFALCAEAILTVNLTTGQPGATLSLGVPAGIAIDQPVDRAFVPALYGGTLSVIDTASDTVTATISLNGFSSGIVVDPTVDSVFVGDRELQRTYVVNASTDTLTGTVATGNVTALGLDPATGDLYAVDAGRSRVVVVDPTNASIVATVPVGADPAGVAFDPANGVAYVPNLHDDNLTEIAPSNWTTRSIPLEPAGEPTGPLVFDPMDAALYAIQSTGSLDVVASASASTVGQIPIGGAPDAIAYDPQDGQIYVSNANTSDLTLLNASLGTVDGGVHVGNDSASPAVDPVTGGVVVALPVQDAIATVAPGTPSSGTTKFVDHEVNSILYDNQTRELYATFWDNGVIGDINGATDRLVDLVGVGTHPTEEALDAMTGTIWVLNAGSNNVSVLDPESDRIVANFGVGSGEDALAWDPVTQCVYVANGGSGNLTVINGTTLRAVGSVGVGAGPSLLTVDPLSGDVFSLSSVDGNISEVAGAPGRVVATIGFGGAAPEYMAFDARQGRLDVGTGTPSQLRVFDAADATAVANVSINGTTNGLGIDPSTDELYVPSFESWPNASVTVIDGATDQVEQTVLTSALPGAVLADPTAGLVAVLNGYGWALVLGNGTGHPEEGAVFVGSEPAGFAADSATGAIYIGDRYQGTVSILWPEPVYNLTFEAQGLPLGTSWTVDVAGVAVSTTAGQFTVPSPNGTYLWTADASGRWSPTPSGGSVTVAEASQTVLIAFGPDYPVTFREVGLLPSGWWSVSLATTTNSSNTTTIGFTLGNGSYSFTAWGPPGWGRSPAGGSFLLNGRAQNFSIAFTPPPRPYPVTLVAQGLPVGVLWNASVNGTSNATTGTSMGWYLPNGTYPFRVAGVPGFELSAYAGSISVQGRAVSVTLDWSASTFPVRFVWGVQPVPPGASSGSSGSLDRWVLVLDGANYPVPVGQSLTLGLANGTYTFAAEPAGGYSDYGPDSGQFNVTGANVSVSIEFSVIATGPPPTTGAGWLPLVGLGVILAPLALVAGWALWVRRRRSRGPPSAAA